VSKKNQGDNLLYNSFGVKME